MSHRVSNRYGKRRKIYLKFITDFSVGYIHIKNTFNMSKYCFWLKFDGGKI